MHENCCESFFCPMDKKLISPHIEWCIGKCPGLCTIFFETSTLVPKVYALSRSYLDCLGYLKKSICMYITKLCSGGF